MCVIPQSLILVRHKMHTASETEIIDLTASQECKELEFRWHQKSRGSHETD